MRRIVSMMFLAACQQSATPTHVARATASAAEPLPTVASASASVAPPPPRPSSWPDAHRIESADKSFSLLYPARMFPKTAAKGDSVSLTSNVSEPSWGKSNGPDIVFAIALTKLHVTPFAEMKRALGKEAMSTIAPDGTEASFKASEGFVDKEKNAYVVRMGIEGTGDVMHLFTTKDGTAWRFDCNYCCGMVGNPKMTSEEQFKICDEVLEAFESEH